MIEAHFSLVDHHGKSVSEQDFRGSWMLVYFGFTHCKVVCPRSLAKLSSALDALGPGIDRIAPLYITVDPARDTPSVMKDWLEENFPRFTGLTGTEDQIEDAKKAFRVFAQRKADEEDADGYVVPHTAIAYLIDPTGEYRAHFLDSVDGETIAARISDIISREENISNA
ncbi:MAG: SCO family protein [Novosphingobium sp.]|nr:SCO family protein [Sphingobium sp.]MCB2052177.1 SCO family protein [Novosphingobium sp.]MCP5400039.1 SCO family protein [Sphingomonas sp.]